MGSNIILLATLIVVFFSCGSQENTKKITIGKSNKKSIESSYLPDITLNDKFDLINASSIEHNINGVKFLVYYNDMAFLKNMSGDECAVFSMSYGGSKNEMSYFDVFYISDTSVWHTNKFSGLNFHNLKFTSVDVANFQTESKVELGITRKELISIKGKQYRETRKDDNTTTLTYSIDDLNSEFLSKYNMPIYLAEFYFRDDELFRYSFGFETP